MKYKVFRYRIDSMDTEYWADTGGDVKEFDSVIEAVKASLDSGFVLDDLAGFHVEPAEGGE